MSFRKSDWPLRVEQLEAIIQLGETTLVEFKREWWNLGTSEGKATMAKDVLALANTVGPEELSIIVIGVDDERRGSQIFPVVAPPTPESISQILSGYAHPVVDVQCRHYALPAGLVSAIAVFYSPLRPHSSLREHPGILSLRDVYVRRDKQLGILTLPELKQMIRAGDHHLGSQLQTGIIEFGFLALGGSGAPQVAVRIRNLAEAPISDVSLFVGITLQRDQSMGARARILTNATLDAGSARDCVMNLGQVIFYGPPDASKNRPFIPFHEFSHVEDTWFEVTAVLAYRDRTGLLQSERITSLLGKW